MFYLEWAERTFEPFVNKGTGKFILFLDNLSAHVDSDFRDAVKALPGLAWFGEPGATDIWKPVDGGYASTLKALIRNELFNWLDDDENMKKRYDVDSHITASEKRILVTHWVGNAYHKLTSSKYHSFRWRMFEKTGCLITADGNEDKTFNLRDCPTRQYRHRSHWTSAPLCHQHPRPQKHSKREMI